MSNVFVVEFKDRNKSPERVAERTAFDVAQCLERKLDSAKVGGIIYTASEFKSVGPLDKYEEKIREGHGQAQVKDDSYYEVPDPELATYNRGLRELLGASISIKVATKEGRRPNVKLVQFLRSELKRVKPEHRHFLWGYEKNKDTDPQNVFLREPAEQYPDYKKPEQKKFDPADEKAWWSHMFDVMEEVEADEKETKTKNQEDDQSRKRPVDGVSPGGRKPSKLSEIRGQNERAAEQP